MDIYFAGTVYAQNTELLRKVGGHQLLSQLNEKKSVEDWVQYKRANPDSKCKLMIDSGAFSAYTKRKKVDVDAYINWMNEIDDVVDYYIQVDKIPGIWGMDRNSPEFSKDAKIAPKKSWNNFLYMRSKAKSPYKILPVYHQGDDREWLFRMLNFKDEHGKPLDYICISSSKDLPKKSNLLWFQQVWRDILSSDNPNIKVHALGLMQLRTLKLYPFASSDSTSWIQTAVNGGIMTPWGNIQVSSRSLHRNDHVSNMLKTDDGEDVDVKDFESFVNDVGFTLEQLMEDESLNRLMFNMSFLSRFQAGAYDDWKIYKNLKQTEVFTNDLMKDLDQSIINVESGPDSYVTLTKEEEEFEPDFVKDVFAISQEQRVNESKLKLKENKKKPEPTTKSLLKDIL